MNASPRQASQGPLLLDGLLGAEMTSLLKIKNFSKSSFVKVHKAELLQLNRTQFPSLGIFVSRKVGNRKN